MPRRGLIARREVPADPLYNSPLVTKFINTMMNGGKRSTAERILYTRFDIIKEKTGDDPLKVFKKAIDNVKPSLEVKSRRVGGSNYQVPVEVNPNRRLSLASAGWSATRSRAATARRCGEAADRAARRGQPARRRREEARRHAPDGRSQQGVRALSLVSAGGRVEKRSMPRHHPSRAHAEHRHHGAHRCRQDDDDRTDPVLHRDHLQDRRGPRRHRRHGLDGAGAGARHHDHVGRDDLLLARPPHQHHRHARATSTSPPRSSARCACSTAPSPCSTRSPASSRSRRRSGARPTSTACRASASSTRWTASARTSSARSTRSCTQARGQPGRDPAADRLRGQVPRRHRPHRDEGDHLQGRDDGRRLHRRRDSGRHAGRGASTTASS